MNSTTHCELLIVNGGFSHRLARKDCSEDFIKTCSLLLDVRSKFLLPNDITLLLDSHVGDYAVTSIYDVQYGDDQPILVAMWFTAWDEDGSIACWEHVLKAKQTLDCIFEKHGGDLNRKWLLSFSEIASHPFQTPWCASFAMPYQYEAGPMIDFGLLTLWAPLVWAHVDRFGNSAYSP